MRNRLAIVSFVLLFAATTAVFATDRRAETLASGTTILAGVELPASTAITDLLADPDAHDGELVQVEGVVVAMCQMMGCWAALDDGAGNRLNVKVEDGVVDLREMAAMEHYMVAEGIFQKVGEHGAQVFIMEHGAVVSTE
jgi:hypothetical protein